MLDTVLVSDSLEGVMLATSPLAHDMLRFAEARLDVDMLRARFGAMRIATAARGQAHGRGA